MKHVFEPDGITYLDKVERCRRCDMPRSNEKAHGVADVAGLDEAQREHLRRIGEGD